MVKRINMVFISQVSDLDSKAGLADDVVGRATRAKHQLTMVECEDANANTPLSEAASKTWATYSFKKILSFTVILLQRKWLPR